MEIKDLILTPFYLPIIYFIALYFRRKEKDKNIRKYFMPALWIKIAGAVSLGLIYQFYYNGGDTFTYFNDTKPIWEAFLNNPFTALRIIFADGNYHPDTYIYTRRIYFYVDMRSYTVVRLAGLFSLFTFRTYTLVSILFACASFSGVWALFKAFYDMYPNLHKRLALAVFFIPSVFFWGSGLMKDTITLAALGWAFNAFYFGIIKKQKIVRNLIVLFAMLFVIQQVKIYILMCFLPATLLWIFLQYRSNIKSVFLRFISLPFLLALALPVCYYAVDKLTEENDRYRLDKLAFTTQETAKWLTQMSTLQEGSGYSLGEFDGSIGNMFSKFPQAVFVTLYQPFLWQAKNPVMMLSALEATIFLFLTLQILLKIKIINLFTILQQQPILAFCLIFSIIFSFGVGIATYNFGSLVRYKIPMMPFFLSALLIIGDQALPKSKRKKRRRLINS